MKIVRAELSDAPLIGRVVVEAIGEDIAGDFAGEKGIDAVVKLFAGLAAREDSQYSYLNALKAVDDDGAAMGFAVGYDGAELHRLRRAFFSEAKRQLDKDMDGKIGDECQPGEYYLDSLAVFPQYRGRGVAKELIKAMAECASFSGKPLGLLCEKTNIRARRLYDSSGFIPVGEAPFAGEIMDHLQLCSI